MKKLFNILLILVFTSSAFSQVDFVTPSTCDILVVVHNDLCTPNWIPGLNGAWETTLLDQKNSMGLNVARLIIQDSQTSTTIKTQIDQLNSSYRYLLIIGDSRRDFEDPNLEYTTSGSNGRFIPLFKTTIDDEYYYHQDMDVKIFNDKGYCEPGTYIGRIPASNNQEIVDYLEKVNNYLTICGGVWSENILEIVDDLSNPWSTTVGSSVKRWMHEISDEYPSSWTVNSLKRNSDGYKLWPDNNIARTTAFENLVNSQTPGYIVSLGTSGNTDNLTHWYYGYNSIGTIQLGCDYPFTNTQYPAFLLSLNSNIGGFDYYNNNTELGNVVENLMFCDGGIVGSLASSGYIEVLFTRLLTLQCVKSISGGDVSSMGMLMEAVLEATIELYPFMTEELNKILLIGDPSLPLPHIQMGIPATIASNTTISAGTYYIPTDINVLSPATLTIEAGATLIFDPGKSLIVASGAGLDVNGTSTNPVTFGSNNSGDRDVWQGISFNGSAKESSLEHAVIRNAEIGVYNSSDPYRVYIDDCEIYDCEIGVSAVNGKWTGVRRSSIHDCDKGYFATHPNSGTNWTVLWGSIVNNCSDIAVEFNTLSTAYFCGTQMDNNELTALKVNNVNNFYLFRELACPNPTNIIKHSGAGGNATSHPAVYLENTYMPYFKNTHIYQNEWGGLKMLSNVTITTNTSNYINNEVICNNHTIDASIADLDMYEIYYGGKNPYFSNRNYNLYNTRITPDDVPYWLVLPTMLTVTPNDVFWGITVADRDDALDRIYYPQGATNNGWDIAPTAFNFNDGGHLTSSFTDDQLQELLNQGLELMADTSGTGGPDGYAAAFDIFEDLLDEAYIPAIRAYGSLVLISGGTTNDAINYLNTLTIEEDDVLFRRARDFYCAEVFVHDNDFDSAIYNFEDISESTEDVYDSIIALINAAEIERLRAIISDINPDGGRGTSGIGGDRSIADAENKLEELYKRLRETQEAEGGLNTAIPTSFKLGNAYPNPFNPSITVPFNVPTDSHVEIVVFNVLGQKVTTLINQPMKAGYHNKVWNGKDINGEIVASGIYFIKMSSPGFTDSKKVVMLK